MTATIPAAIRAVLACPKCQGELTDVRHPSGSESLDCPNCGLRFPVRDGIPILLLEQAERRDA